MSQYSPLHVNRRTVMAGILGAAANAGRISPAKAAGSEYLSDTPDIILKPTGSFEKPWTAEGWVKVAGGRIHWAELGDGPPVLLLPKLGGWLADWRHVAALLAPSFRLIAMDPPGHGASSMEGPPPFLLTQEESASMIVKSLDALGINRCAMVGNSMGGSISLVAATLWPDRVGRLAMISTALPKAVPLADIIGSADKRDQVYDNDKITYEQIYRLFGATQQTYEEYVLSQQKAGVWKDPSERGVRRAGLLEYLMKVSCPTMLVYGDRSGLGYRKYLPDIKRYRPDIPIAEVPNSGTFTHQDNPVATAQLLQKFLA